MTKSKILVVVSVLLLLLNLALVAFVFLGRHHHPTGEGPKQEIIERLQFDEDQIADYEALIIAHREEIFQANIEIQDLKVELYSSLAENEVINADSLIQEISNKQMAIENIHYHHFLDIKALCKENQRADFNLLSKDLAELFRKGPMIKGE